MGYLESKEQEGVTQYLVQKLHSESMVQLDLYLPQLCYLTLSKENKNCRHVLEKFILEISVKNTNIGFRALNYFCSWSEDREAQYAERAMDFHSLLEGALVNADLPKQYKTISNRNTE